MSRPPTEAETRRALIDDQLAQAGWGGNRLNLLEEFLLAPAEIADLTASYDPGKEYADYALLGSDSKPIALVEAKRASRDALAGQRQAADYADRIKARFGTDPFIFLSNGKEIWFWDRAQYPLRKVSGFYSPDDLERLRFQREYRQPLDRTGPNPAIAGRDYQIEAIRRITEAMAKGQRKFLLVMATGTGKTRTVVALVDLLMRAKWAQRVLFLADRRELVRQALGDFKEHMPNETRTRVESNSFDLNARIHVSTYPSLIQIYKQLSPGYYDLIIADESHRSIYNRYRALLDHFDALQIGLTATPTDYIDHNTFDLFECPDGLPTFYYSYETAVEEGYLVNYRVLEAQTTFQLEGIKAGQLPAQFQRQLEEQGIDLSEIDFEGSDIERRVTNTGTNDAIVSEFMTRCRRDATGTLPAKTIFFAMTHRHAVELWKSFNRLYPDLQTRGLAQIIDSHMERADKLLDDFKHKDMPRVAISVDMLDTGIDVPAIENLVFAKPVFSQVKFWQMIGRGTRLHTDSETGEKKKDFLIIDHWNNFAYFRMNPEGEITATTEPLPVRLFRLRLEKAALLSDMKMSEESLDAIAQLQSMIASLPRENVNVRPHLSELARLAQSENWLPLISERVDHLSKTIAPLMRFLPDVNLSVMTFEVRAERLAVAHLSRQQEQAQRLREKITEDLKRLPVSLKEVSRHAEKRTWALSDGFWDHLDYARIMDMQATFAPLMRYRESQRKEIITLNLPDRIALRRWIIYGPGGEGSFAETYREKVEAHVRNLADQLTALIKLRRGETPTEEEIKELADALNGPDLFITEETLRKAYDRPDADFIAFLRHILELDRLPCREEEIQQAFDDFIAANPHFTATQISFLRTARSAVLSGARLTRDDMEKPPFSRVGRAENLFSQDDLAQILDLANKFVA